MILKEILYYLVNHTLRIRVLTWQYLDWELNVSIFSLVSSWFKLRPCVFLDVSSCGIRSIGEISGKLRELVLCL